jgi:hypothetical protein
MTDDAPVYTKAVTCGQTLDGRGLRQARFRPRRPQADRKVKRLNRTLL